MNLELHTPPDIHAYPSEKDTDCFPQKEKNLSRLRAWGVTIDPEASYDLDDAFSLEPITGGMLLSVHISDVASVVSKGSQLDLYARSRITSRYQNEVCIDPMFPRAYAKNNLGLLPGKRRNTVSIRFPVSYEMEMESPFIELTSFKNKRRYNYDEITEVVTAKKDYHDLLVETSGLTRSLKQMRKKSVGIYDETTWEQDRWVPDRELRQASQKVSGHEIINEVMLLANIGFLRFCYRNDIPILYRNHAIHVATGNTILTLYHREKLSELSQTFQDMKIIYPPHAASYNPDGLGHFDMKRRLYGSFSSPIRKFSDLVNQRNLEAFYEHKEFPYEKDELYEIAADVNRIKA